MKQQLQRVLNAYVHYFKRARPHQGIKQQITEQKAGSVPADTLKHAVSLTFPQGAQLKDPKELFNTRLESNTVRAIDFHEGDMGEKVALKVLILAAVGLNTRTSASDTRW